MFIFVEEQSESIFSNCSYISGENYFEEVKIKKFVQILTGLQVGNQE